MMIFILLSVRVIDFGHAIVERLARLSWIYCFGYPANHHCFFDLTIFSNEYFLASVYQPAIGWPFLWVWHFHAAIFSFSRWDHNQFQPRFSSFWGCLSDRRFIFINFSSQGCHWRLCCWWEFLLVWLFPGTLEYWEITIDWRILLWLLQLSPYVYCHLRSPEGDGLVLIIGMVLSDFFTINCW